MTAMGSPECATAAAKTGRLLPLLLAVCCCCCVGSAHSLMLEATADGNGGAGVNSSSCHWQRWRCTSRGISKDSDQAHCKLTRTRVCSDGSVDAEQTISTAAEQKALGVLCPRKKFLGDRRYCSTSPTFDPERFPVSAWCPWQSWGEWKLECRDRAVERHPELDKLVGKKQAVDLWHWNRQRARARPRRSSSSSCPTSGSSEWCRRAPSAPVRNLAFCHWLSWDAWSDTCSCFMPDSVRTRGRQCQCPDGVLKARELDASTRRRLKSGHVFSCSGLSYQLTECPDCSSRGGNGILVDTDVAFWPTVVPQKERSSANVVVPIMAVLFIGLTAYINYRCSRSRNLSIDEAADFLSAAAATEQQQQQLQQQQQEPGTSPDSPAPIAGASVGGPPPPWQLYAPPSPPPPPGFSNVSSGCVTASAPPPSYDDIVQTSRPELRRRDDSDGESGDDSVAAPPPNYDEAVAGARAGHQFDESLAA